MPEKLISIAKDFSDTPMGRYYSDGPFSGQRFRQEFLIPALESADIVVIDVDDIEGSGSSFLEEAFGGLLREGRYKYAELKMRLQIMSHQPPGEARKRLIEEYMEQAAKDSV